MANQFVHGNEVGPSPSMFRVIIEWYYSDTGTGWHVTFKYWVQVTAGDFWGTRITTSWGTSPTIGTPGPYGESGWGTKDIAYGASWSTSCSAGYSSHNSTATLNITVPMPTYKVTFNATENGGVGDTEKTVKQGESIPELPEASKPYHKFLGWFTAKSGGTKITEKTVFTSDTTVYAQFELEASMVICVDETWNPANPYVRENMGMTFVVIDEEWKQGYGGV